MKIASYVVAGVKGIVATIEPVPHRLLLMGEPGSGKSGRIEGLRFGFLGHVPALGKSEAATARLMDGEPMSTSIRLEDGRAFRRILERDGKRLATRIESWHPAEATTTERHSGIVSLVGATEDEAAQHLDVRALLNAGPGDRVRYVMALLDSGASPADLSLRARLLAYARAAEWPGQVPAAGPEYAGRAERFLGLLSENGLDAGQRAALGEVGGVILSIFAAKGLAEAHAAAKKAKLDADGDARLKIAARAEIEARSVAAGIPTESLADLRRRREALDRAIGSAATEVEEARRYAGRLAGARGVVLRAGEALAAAVKAAEGAPAARAEADRMDVERASLLDPSAPTPPTRYAPNAESLARAKALREEAEALAAKGCEPYSEDELRAAERVARAAREEAYAAAHAASSRRLEADSDARLVEEAKASPQSRALGLLDVLGGMGFECAGGPLTNARAYLDLVAIVRHTVPDVAALERSAAERLALVGPAEAAAAAARKASEEADAKVEAVRADLKRRADAEGALIGKVAELRAEADRLTYAAHRGADEANAREAEAFGILLAEHGRVVADNRARREALERAAAVLRKDADEAAGKVDRCRAIEEEARRALEAVEAAPVKSEEEAVAQAQAARLDLVDVAGKLSALEAANARARELADLAEKITAAERRAKAGGAFAWAFDRIREEELGRRGGPLIERMERFLKGARRPEVPFLRAAKGGLEIGWLVDGRERPLEALSGGETVLFLAGLAAAVIAIRAPAVRVLMVEAAEVGNRRTQEELLAGLDAVEDGLDHVIVATCVDVPTAADRGWSIMDLGSVPRRA